MWQIPLFVILATLLSQACKGTDQKGLARTKTLDSIAFGSIDLEKYQCRAANVANRALITDDQIVFDKSSGESWTKTDITDSREAVNDYFSALPNEVVSLFTQRFGGTVLITRSPQKYCENAYYKKPLEKGELPKGCFNFVSDPTGRSAPIFTIVQTPDPKEIRYYGPQIFGYIYAQFYSRLDINPKTRMISPSEHETSDFVSLKEDVAEAFLRDIVNLPNGNGAGANLTGIKNILGESALDNLKQASTPRLMDRAFTPEEDDKRRSFRDYVFANSFQSAHCNDESRRIASEKFKKSFEQFSSINRKVSELSRLLMGTEYADSGLQYGNEVGFSLASGGGLSALMPLFGRLQGMRSGGGGGPDLAGLFSSLLTGSGGGGSSPQFSAQSVVSNMFKSFAQLHRGLAAAGCTGSNCGGCTGNCCGGTCSMCPNGNVGGGCGSCSVYPG